MPVILGPAVLILLCWGVSLVIATLAISMPDVFDLLPAFLRREGRDLSIFKGSGLGFMWILTALAAFLVGCLAAKVAYRPSRSLGLGIDALKTVRVVSRLNLVFLSVTLVWICVSAAQVGGLTQLVLLLRWLYSLDIKQILSPYTARACKV